MIYNLKKLILFAAGAMFFLSCESDLNKIPESTTSFDNFYQTSDDATSALNGVYKSFRDMSNTLYLYGDMRSDLIVQGNLGAGSDVNRNTITQNTEGTDWTLFYKVINGANLLIDNIDNIEFSNENERNDIKSQALALRALTYFYMVRIWGDVPLITVGISSVTQSEVFPEGRTSSDLVFDQIIADIDQAENLFSTEQVVSRYQISKPALSTLEAEVFLWQAKVRDGGAADLDRALTAINSAIDNSGATLSLPYSQVFRTTEASAGDIFSVYYDQIEQSESAFWVHDFLISGEFYNLLTEESQADTPLVSNPQGETVAQRFTTSDQFRTYFDEAGDVREDFYFHDITYSDNTTSHVFNKFIGSETSANTREFTDDVKIYRLADLILLKAEILNAMGETSLAIMELDKVRTRAGISGYSGAVTREDLDTAILQERARELGFEAKRWFDLIRFDRVADYVDNLVGVDPQRYLWPISANTRSLNSNLSQTPGY